MTLGNMKNDLGENKIIQKFWQKKMIWVEWKLHLGGNNLVRPGSEHDILANYST